MEIRGQRSSQFPNSGSAIATTLWHWPASSGQRIVVVTLGGKSVRASGARLERYIELDGNPARAGRYDRVWVLPQTETPRDVARNAKDLVHVSPGAPGYSTGTRIILSPAAGAILMSASTVIAAINALVLRHARLNPPCYSLRRESSNSGVCGG